MFNFIEIAIEPCLIYSLIGTIITSIVVIVGWSVNNSHANARQARIELIAKKDELCRDLDKLDDATREYYAGPEDKRNLAKLEIEAKLSSLDKIIELIEQKHNEKKLYKKFTSLYEAITDGSFGSDNINNEVSKEKYKRILLAKEQLYSEIEATFCSKKSNEF